MPGSYVPPLPKKNTYISGGADLHTTPIDVTAEDAYISSIRLTNTAATATTVIITDKSTELNLIYDALSLAASEISKEQLPGNQELFCEGGFDIKTSQAGVEANIVYWTRPAQ